MPPPEDPVAPPPDPAPPPPQPEPVPVVVSTPVAPPVTPVVVEAGYPRELVLRPLILPQGGFEGSALFVLQTLSTGGSDSDSQNHALIQPRLRYGFGAGEVELAASFLAYEPEDTSMFPIERETFQNVSVAGRFKVAPSTVIGAELGVFSPVGDVKTYAPRAIAATKLHLSAASAAELAFKGGINHVEEQSESSIGGNTVVLSSELRVQAQVAPEVAVEGRALLAYYNLDDDDSFEGSPGSYFLQTYGVWLVGSVSRDIDLSAGFDIVHSNGDFTMKLFSVGIAARRVP